MSIFDADGIIEDFLADDEPDLHDKQWRFKARVNKLMQHHNSTREDAEAIVETVIRTKETDKRCTCGEVAQFVVKGTKEIVCGACRIARCIDRNSCL